MGNRPGGLERSKAADQFVQHLRMEERSAGAWTTPPVPLLYPGSTLARTFRDRGSTHGELLPVPATEDDARWILGSQLPMSAYSSSTQHVLRDKRSLDCGMGGLDGGTAEVKPCGNLFNPAGPACSPSQVIVPALRCTLGRPSAPDLSCAFITRSCVFRQENSLQVSLLFTFSSFGRDLKQILAESLGLFSERISKV